RVEADHADRAVHVELLEGANQPDRVVPRGEIDDHEPGWIVTAFPERGLGSQGSQIDAQRPGRALDPPADEHVRNDGDPVTHRGLLDSVALLDVSGPSSTNDGVRRTVAGDSSSSSPQSPLTVFFERQHTPHGSAILAGNSVAMIPTGDRNCGS